MKNTIKEAFLASIPVMMGYIVLGMAFGILLEDKGYSFVYALCMSVFIYAGSMQFVAIELLTSQATWFSALIMTLLINARHLVYGLSMIKKFENMNNLKPYMIFSLTDETYSLLVSVKTPSNCNQKYYYFFIALLNQSYWIIGSLLGSLLRSLVTINTTGLDFAMTALFIVIVIEQYLNSKQHLYTYIGFIISIISLFIFGSDAFIIPSIILIILSLLYLYQKGGKKRA